jgi:hypothetical protein
MYNELVAAVWFTKLCTSVLDISLLVQKTL